jgi:hypothetical protein
MLCGVLWAFILSALHLFRSRISTQILESQIFDYSTTSVKFATMHKITLAIVLGMSLNIETFRIKSKDESHSLDSFPLALNAKVGHYLMILASRQ